MIKIVFFYDGGLVTKLSLHHPQLGEHVEFDRAWPETPVLVVQEVRWRPDKDELYVFLMPCAKHEEQCS